MDDSFRVRVDKIFGNLDPSSSVRSLWSLSDAEVEKREWNRQRDSPDREDIPCSSSFNGFLNKKKKSKNEFDDDDMDDLDDDDDDDENGENEKENEQGPCSSNQSFNGDEHEKEEWEIRNSIGLDSTLDNEDEEDEYDKVAVGRENAGERTYLKDVTDYGTCLDLYGVIPNSFKDHIRDPRAIPLPAKIRIEEEIEITSDKVQLQTVGDPEVKVNQDVGNLKPILKRKENQSDRKSQKRVRFDPECKDNYKQEFENPNSVIGTSSIGDTAAEEDTSFLPRRTSEVPDYVRNPSKYTRYTFDSSSEVDEQSNKQAYLDFLNTIRKSDPSESQPESIVELPKSIIFTPKKKVSDGAPVKKDTEMNHDQDDTSKKSNIRRGGIPLAAIETVENEACAMEEDEEQPTMTDKRGSSKKAGRQYRSKISCEDSPQ